MESTTSQKEDGGFKKEMILPMLKDGETISDRELKASRKRAYERRDDLEKFAKDNDLIIVFPKSTELFIDIDDEASMAHFFDTIDLFTKMFEVVSYEVYPSKSGDPVKRHIIVTMKKNLTEMARIAFQAFLGSDRRRELRSYVDHQDAAVATVFLEKRGYQVSQPSDKFVLTDGGDWIEG